MMKNNENVTESFSIYIKNNLENERIENFLNIDVNKISNNDAKISVFQLLAFPLQNLCRYLKYLDNRLINQFCFTPYKEIL